MDNLKTGLIKIFYAITLITLSIYSYSQIDLNLTLSSNILYQNIQKQLILLGYYNRPLSGIIFLLILLLMFINYFAIFKLAKRGFLNIKDIIHLLIITVAILLFSYPAFSYDIFNYIFDSRILVKYGLNPYQYKALDFAADPWIRFMHWTHRTYPYGPVWLILTIIPYILGFGKFVLTLLNFRLFFIAAYLINIYILNKILIKLKYEERLLLVSFFAFNPLIIMETVVSPHNESLMLTGIYAAIYFYLNNKLTHSYISLIISGGIKFLSWVILPIFYIAKKWQWKNEKTFKVIFFSQLILLIPVIYLREAYPWYFITIIGLSSLIKYSRFIIYLTLGISIGVLLRYLPFIYFGDYGPSTNSWQLYLTIIPFIIFGVAYLRGKINLI